MLRKCLNIWILDILDLYHCVCSTCVSNRIFEKKRCIWSYLHIHLVSQSDTGRQMALLDQNGHTACLLDMTDPHRAPQELGTFLLFVKRQIQKYKIIIQQQIQRLSCLLCEKRKL